MAKAESKRIIASIAVLAICLAVLLCGLLSNGDFAAKAQSRTGSWDDYAADELTLLDPSKPNAKDNPYIISSAADIAYLSVSVNQGQEYINQYFLQTADIDLDAHYFTPIGQNVKGFSGIYDGNGHTISNLYIDQPQQTQTGLFGYVRTTANPDDESGTLINITISGGEVRGGVYVGGIAGFFNGKKIYNCKTNLVIKQGETDNSYIGGITGFNRATIEKCYFNGEIDAPGGLYVGGIAGRNAMEGDESRGIITDCFNAGSVKGSNFVGGIAGHNNGTIKNIFNSGRVEADINCGGIIGYNNGHAAYGYNIGATFFGLSYAGAVLGGRSSNALSYNLYYNKSAANTPFLDIKAIGRENRPISEAADDIENNVIGLYYHEMINLAPSMELEQGNWTYFENTENFGYLPNLKSFDGQSGIKEYAKFELFGGDSTSPDWGRQIQPYLISKAEQFAIISHNVNNGITGYQNKTFKLIDNIDFSSIGNFEPIGGEARPFNADIEGGNLALRNLSLNGDGNTALIAFYDGGSIRELTVENFTVNGGGYTAALVSQSHNARYEKIKILNSAINGQSHTAGLAAFSDQDQIIECEISSSAISGNNDIGGLTGRALDSLIQGCGSKAEIYGLDRAGGIAGRAETAQISQSYFAGKLEAQNRAGGIAGESSAYIYQCFSYVSQGSLKGKDYVGGIAGLCSGGAIEQCYARTNILGAALTGGIAGRLTNDGEIKDCYFTGSISHSGAAAALATTDATSSITNSYYNSDYIKDQEITLNGEGVNSLELTDSGILSSAMINAPKQALYGYFPQIAYFQELDTALQSARYYYFNDGDGEGHAYEITDDIQLRNMQRLIKKYYAEYGSKNYQMKSDIYLYGDFEPIAGYDYPFTGTFWGNYYSIYSLCIDAPQHDYVGLFARIGEGGYVREVNIRPHIVSSEEIYGFIQGGNYVGAIAGISEGYIWDCMNNIEITGDDYVGGLAGQASNINRSFNTAEVTGQNYVGGIAGEAKGIIQTCFNSGYILVNGNYGGGIAGKNAVQIEYCYNSGNIESAPVSGGYTGNYKGGIAGLNDLAATIRNSYSIAQLKGVSAGFVAGGLVGINNSTGISNCYYNIETVEGLNAAGQGSQGGENVLGLTTVQMVGTTALQNMIFTPGIYVSDEDRGMDADYAPQLRELSQMSAGEGKNTGIDEIIRNFSKQSVMLRLFGRDIHNPMDWGSESNPYLISTYDHLDTLSKQVAAGHDYTGCYFLVTADITVQPGFLSIGSYNINDITQNRIFNGVFDGDGHTIHNLVLGGPESALSQGLFGYTGAQSVIKNIIIGSGHIQAMEKAGSVVGYSLGEITRCLSRATVEGHTSIGGIAGQLRANQISHCLFEGDIYADSDYYGGIVGRLEDGGAGIYNCWFLLDLDAEYHHNNIGSLLYNDKNGDIEAGINTQASDIRDILYFDFLPNGNFGFDLRNYGEELIDIGEGKEGARYYPMYNQRAYNGDTLVWYGRFTQKVTIGELQYGTAHLEHSHGNYYEGQTVTILISPDIGYRLVLDEGAYTYQGDGETIFCYATMGKTSWVFEAQFAPFGDNPSEIVNPNGQTATLEDDEFDYDGQAKVYQVNIAGFTAITEYYIAAQNFKVEEAKAAERYKLVIKLQYRDVIVGIKNILFTIKPLKLQLDLSALESDYYAVKQYDKDIQDNITFDQSAIIGIVGSDEITLKAVRRFFNLLGQPDGNIGEDKLVAFTDFVIEGIAAGNYAAPDPITDIPGKIKKKDAWVVIYEEYLTKAYDGEAPKIMNYFIEGELPNDGLLINEFSFEREDGLPSEGWNVGRYIVGLTDNISGNIDNYNLMFLPERGENPNHYYFEITPKVISHIDFEIEGGALRYNGASQNEKIRAWYTVKEESFASADIIFYYDNQPIEQCVNAGEYIAKAIINNANFLLEREQSISFTIAKIAQPTPLVIDHIEDIDYSVTSMDLTASGGDGEGALRFDAISGQARVEGNKLYIEGTGEVKLRAVKEESQNYLAQYSPTVSFRVNKGVLRAILDDITIEYGDTPIIEIRYEGYLRNEQSKNDIKGLIEPDIYIDADTGGVLAVNLNGYDIRLLDNGESDGYIIDVSTASAKLYVLKKKINVLAQAASKVYGQPDPILGYKVLEDENIVLTGEMRRRAGEDAGEYLIEQGDLTEQHNPNYQITFIPNYLTIRPKELRVSIPQRVKSYGSPDPAVSFEVNEEDLRPGDSASIVTGQITRDAGEDVGVYKYRAVNAWAGGNYTVRFTSVGSLTIQKATPQFIQPPQASAIVYGDTLAQSIITGKANVNGEFVWNQPSIAPTVYNSLTTLYDCVFVPDNQNNHNTVNLRLTILVNPRPLTIAFIGNSDFVYDGSEKGPLQAVAYNTLEGDQVSVTITYSAERLINAGSYTATASVDNINYYIPQGSGVKTITIARSRLDVKLEDAEINEGDSYTPRLTYTGFKGLDDESALKSKPTVKDIPKEAGVYTLTPQGGSADNYILYYHSGKLTINRLVYQTEEITIKGVFSPDSEVALSRVEAGSSGYEAMRKHIEKVLTGAGVKEYTLDGYVNLKYSKAPQGECEYSVKGNIPKGAPLIVLRADGSMEIIKDYEYSDGTLTFTSSNVAGIALVRDKTFWEENRLYLIIAGASAAAAFAVAAITVMAVKIKKRRERRMPKFRD